MNWKDQFDTEFLPCRQPIHHSTERCIGLDKHDLLDPVKGFISQTLKRLIDDIPNSAYLDPLDKRWEQVDYTYLNQRVREKWLT